MDSETRHDPACSRVFKRYDPECPRCRELSQGAKPRPSWWRSPVDDIIEERTQRWLRTHSCEKEGCGPVCTYGDW